MTPLTFKKSTPKLELFLHVCPMVFKSLHAQVKKVGTSDRRKQMEFKNQ